MERVPRLAVVLLCGAAVAAIALAEDKDKAAPLPGGAGRVSPGEYVEVDDKGVPNPVFAVLVREVTPNILEIRGVNGWVTYASYDEAQKEYRGFFEWQQFGPIRSPGGKWADLYEVRLVRQHNGQLHMSGKSKANDFVIRAAPKP
jgi:hypothetical protein